jgi:hypothetical protein
MPTTRGGDLKVVGLTAQHKLICFESDRPDHVSTIGRIRGLTMDARLVGIDYRPATGDLYGLGDAGGIYTLEVRSADATYVARLNVALTGTQFDVDFNPTVDRLRIVSDTGQNLRANVDDGTTTVDAMLNYVGPPAVNPAAGIGGAAYTNNDVDPDTATTLFDIDSNLDQVAIQAPPNTGTLNPTGKLGVDATGPIGFDIYSVVRDGSTEQVRGFAALTTSTGSRFYEVNLFTGSADRIGRFYPHVVDIAIPLQQG